MNGPQRSIERARVFSVGYLLLADWEPTI